MNRRSRAHETAPDLAQMYTDEVRQVSMLSREEEVSLARRAHAGDTKALQALVAANLRFVQKAAHKYDGYGMNYNDLVQEGNIGLLLAAKKFDPERGFRLISYAVWYIDSAIRAYVLKNWSLVKMGTTALQRKLFFKLRGAYGDAMRTAQDDRNTAIGLLEDVFGEGSRYEIEHMGARLAVRDLSMQGESSGHALNDDDDGAQTLEDQLASGADSPLSQAEETDRAETLREMFDSVRNQLDARGRAIFDSRITNQEYKTLTATGKELGISRERVRQLEIAMRKTLLRTLVDARERGLV